ncbi:MAG: MOSC domain-containing protein, partial [Streptomyces sp.]
MTTPRVATLHLYPVKALAGTAREELMVEPWGPAADRRWLLTTPAGEQVTQREQPRLALASAEPLPGGGIRLAAPGRGPLEVAVPSAESPESPGLDTVPVRVWRSKVEA